MTRYDKEQCRWKCGWYRPVTKVAIIKYILGKMRAYIIWVNKAYTLTWMYTLYYKLKCNSQSSARLKYIVIEYYMTVLILAIKKCVE